jgi:hypothetical protein
MKLYSFCLYIVECLNVGYFYIESHVFIAVSIVAMPSVVSLSVFAGLHDTKHTSVQHKNK